VLITSGTDEKYGERRHETIMLQQHRHSGTANILVASLFSLAHMPANFAIHPISPETPEKKLVAELN
jgi:hypothetical protein